MCRSRCPRPRPAPAHPRAATGAQDDRPVAQRWFRRCERAPHRDQSPSRTLRPAPELALLVLPAQQPAPAAGRGGESGGQVAGGEPGRAVLGTAVRATTGRATTGRATAGRVTAAGTAAVRRAAGCVAGGHVVAALAVRGPARTLTVRRSA